MLNVILFALTTMVYSLMFWVSRGRPTIPPPPIQRVKELCTIALLCLPLNINGNVFTILGNAESDKDILSVFSVYQKADRDAVSIFGSFVQLAGHDAIIPVGISGFQKGGNEAFIGIGLSGYQKSDKEVGGFILISGYQESKRDALNLLGATGYQKAGNIATMFCCFMGRQDAATTEIYLGLTGFQSASEIAETKISVALLQRAGTRERAFAIWSKLKSEGTN